MNEIKNIGIVGDGQLGRMLTEAALPMGYEVIVEGSAGPNSPAAQVGARQIDGSLKDGEAIRKLARSSDVLTIEVEHVDVETLIDLLNEGYNVQPSPYSMISIVDKHLQKLHYRANYLPTPAFEKLDNDSDLASVRDNFKALIVKTRTMGYDGRGNLIPTAEMNLADIRKELSDNNGYTPPLYAEKLVSFQRELAVIGARDRLGNISLYPVVETIHTDNICNIVIAPAAIDPRVQKAAEDLGRSVIESFAGAGVFAIEMFQDEADQVLINETAPRVHNSGHFSIEGSETSQFTQHIRAITGQRLGNTAMTAPAAVMVNILGSKTGEFDVNGFMKIAARNIFPHHYGKSLRPKRKVAHFTVLGDDLAETYSLAMRTRETIDA